MRLTPKFFCAALLAAALAPTLLPAATWTVGATGADFTTLQAAIASASVVNGDTLSLQAGTYTTTRTATAPAGFHRITKQLTIEGAGIDQTILTHAVDATSNTDTIFIAAAPNITVRNLTIRGGVVVSTTPTTVGFTTLVTQHTGADNLTLDTVKLEGLLARRSVILNSATSPRLNATITNSQFEGTFYRQGITQAGANLTVTNNVFNAAHYQEGPIEAGTGSLNVSYNYFTGPRVVIDHRTGLVEANGGFNSAGDLMYLVKVQGSLTANTLISHNTFVYPDYNTTNASGAYAKIRAIEYGAGAISNHTIRDNIFYGYKYFPLSQSTAPIMRPTSGQFGGAIEFDGYRAVGTFQDALFNVGTSGTLSVWVKLDSTTKRNQILEGPGDAGLEFQYRNNSGGQFYMRTTTVGGDFVISSGPDATTNWVNIQYTWDFATNRARIYKDGVEVAYLTNFTPTDLTWAAAIDTTTGVINLGQDPGDTSRAFDGLMDDLVIFNAALSTTDLDTIRTSGSSALASDSRLVARWTFDEAAGATVLEDSKNSIDLNLGLITPPAAGTGVLTAGATGLIVNNNLYFDNDVNTNVADAAQVLADPLFRLTGSTVREKYTPQSNSPAIGAASDGTTIGAAQLTQPTTVTNLPLTVVRGGTATITSAFLNTTDPEQSAAQLTYTVTTSPARGVLSLSTFTQADINNGLLTYTNTNGGTADSFAFSVTDGTTNPVTGSFSITVAAATDSDRDGIADAIEVSLGTNVNDRDSDNDGVEDGVERAIGSNPLDNGSPVDRTDADGDLIPDAYETANGMNASSIDQDGDGYVDGYEFALNGTATLAGVPPLGRATNDAVVNNSDAIRLLEIFLGLGFPVKSDEEMDVNRDGRVDNVDAIILYQFTLNRVAYLPFPPQ